jgi:hypothetical protein
MSREWFDAPGHEINGVADEKSLEYALNLLSIIVSTLNETTQCHSSQRFESGQIQTTIQTVRGIEAFCPHRKLSVIPLKNLRLNACPQNF